MPRFRRIRRVALAILATICVWYATGIAVWWVADRASDQGRLTMAEEWLHVYCWLRPGATNRFALEAQIARRRHHHAQWSKLIEQWTAKSPTAPELAIEKELMRAQFGVFEPDTQAQLNRLLAAGAEPNVAAAAFVCGYLIRQDSTQAERILRNWDSQGRFPTDANYYRAVSARMKGDLNEAKELFESVIKSSPHHELAREAVADLLLESRQPREALKHYLAVLSEAPASVTARIGAAKCLRYVGQWTVAADILKTVSDRDSMLFAEGQIALERGDYPTALTSFEHASDQDSENQENRLALATVLALTGNRDKAREILDSENKLQSLQKQLRDLQIRTSLDPNDSDALRKLKMVKTELLRERN